MTEAVLTIRNQAGMHARAARVFVNTASKFRARVTVSREDLEVDGKSILGVMMLAAELGAEIRVRAEGEDEGEALEAICRVVEEKFGEE